MQICLLWTVLGCDSVVNTGEPLLCNFIQVVKMMNKSILLFLKQ